MLSARHAAIASVLTLLAMLPACAVSREGVHRDDASITEAIRVRFAADRTVDASAIKVETHNGVVVLTGTARDWTEKTCAEQIALKVDDVRTIRNEIVLRG